jgi:hypothetical protein
MRERRVRDRRAHLGGAFVLPKVFEAGLIICKLYAGKLPYQYKTDVFISLKTLSGQRPARVGTHELEHAYMNPLWDMMVRGWAMEPASRCKLTELDAVLKTLDSQPMHL